MSGNAETVIELDRQRMIATVSQDLATLDGILADDLVYTHSSARMDTKASFIDGLTSGSNAYTSLEPSDVKAQDLGDVVVLTGVCAMSVSLSGRPTSFRVRFADVYAMRDGRWQMVTWQSTRLR
jgi:ketosteroid isomerase-like protein